MEFDLNLNIYRLLLGEPFFAGLSRCISKIKTKAIPTAGVTFNKNVMQFELLYNPDFFKDLTVSQQLGVIKHEFYHIIFEHIIKRRPDDCENYITTTGHDLWNIATDLAINSFLEKDEIIDGGLIPGVGPFKKLPTLQSAEWYYKELKKSSKPMPSCSCGTHEFWNNLSDEEKDIIKERLKGIIKKGVDEATSQNRWGTISQQCKDFVIDYIKGNLVDWKKVLSFFIKASQKADKANTLRRVNKRYPYIYPGKKNNRHANIAVSVDQSGSVSDEDLVLFFNEISKLSKIATFTVIPFDVQVNEKEIFVWKKNERKKVQRVFSGGTDFNAPTDYVNEHKNFDGHIIVTDLQAEKPKPSKCQRLWITTKEDMLNAPFQTNERIVAIEK